MSALDRTNSGLISLPAAAVPPLAPSLPPPKTSRFAALAVPNGTFFQCLNEAKSLSAADRTKIPLWFMANLPILPPIPPIPQTATAATVPTTNGILKKNAFIQVQQPPNNFPRKFKLIYNHFADLFLNKTKRSLTQQIYTEIFRKVLELMNKAIIIHPAQPTQRIYDFEKLLINMKEIAPMLPSHLMTIPTVAMREAIFRVKVEFSVEIPFTGRKVFNPPKTTFPEGSLAQRLYIRFIASLITDTEEGFSDCISYEDVSKGVIEAIKNSITDASGNVDFDTLEVQLIAVYLSDINVSEIMKTVIADIKENKRLEDEEKCLGEWLAEAQNGKPRCRDFHDKERVPYHVYHLFKIPANHQNNADLDAIMEKLVEILNQADRQERFRISQINEDFSKFLDCQKYRPLKDAFIKALGEAFGAARRFYFSDL